MADKRTSGKSKGTGPLLTFLLVFFGIVFVGSGFMLSKELIQSKKEKDAFEQMNAQLHSAIEKAEAEEKSQEGESNRPQFPLCILFHQFKK